MNIKKTIKYAESFAYNYYKGHNDYEFNPAVGLEDILQECRIAAWQAIENYDPEKEAKWETFLHNVLENRMVDYNRVETVSGLTPKPRTDDAADDRPYIVSMDAELDNDGEAYDNGDEFRTLHDIIPSHRPGQEEICMKEEVTEILNNLLDDLVNPEDAEILRMYFFDDMTHEEIGEDLGKPTRTISKRVEDALEELREISPYDIEDLL